jgi:hypothetical protein
MQSEYPSQQGDGGMTDYQFRCYEEYRNHCEHLERELAALLSERDKREYELRRENPQVCVLNGIRALQID